MPRRGQPGPGCTGSTGRSRRPITGSGACHAVEIPYVFDTSARADVRPLIGDAPSQAVADRAHRVWVDFITRGEPGWAPYDTASRTTGLLSGEDQSRR